MVAILSTINPDYEDLVSQFLSALANKESWKSDLVTASTGRILVEMIAQVGAYDQLSIERSLQETSLDTARMSSSVYTIARMLGAHIKRRTPANAEVTLTRVDTTTSLSLPAYTKFSLGKTLLYNAEAVTFPIGVATMSSTLYEGTVVTETFTSDGSAFQTFSLGSIEFAVSDIHLNCKVGIIESTKIQNGLWSYGPLDTIFYENTKPDGIVEILFGNGVYGAIPTSGETITFTYANTNGSGGNQSTTGQVISCLDFTSVSGTPTTALTQGEDKESAEFYKIVGPSTFSSQGRAVTREDYRGKILEYADVVDCIITTQADSTHRTDVTWMNFLGITLITGSTWTSGQWTTFVAWLNTIGMTHIQYVSIEPIQSVMDVSVEIFCFKKEDLNSAKALAETAITNYFTEASGSLGRSVFKTDIEDAIFKAFNTSVVDYIKMLAPAVDFEVTNVGYVTLGTLTVSTAFTERNKGLF